MANSTFTVPRQYRFHTSAPGIAVTSGPLTLFTVAGGRVLIHSITGVVATDIGGSATTIKLSANVAGTDSDLCAASASIASKIAGTLLVVQGPVATALLISTGEGAAPGPSVSTIVRTCTIDLVMATGGTTGTVDWSCLWEPLDLNATIA